MRAVLLLALLLTVRDGWACVWARIVPPELSDASEVTVDRYFLKQDFDRADIVVLATVTSVRNTSASYLAQIEPIAVFKSDSKPIQWVFDTYDMCKYGMRAGGTYIVFGSRTKGLLDHMNVSPQPITPSSASSLVDLTDSESALESDIVHYMYELTVIPVTVSAK